MFCFLKHPMESFPCCFFTQGMYFFFHFLPVNQNFIHPLKLSPRCKYHFHWRHPYFFQELFPNIIKDWEYPSPFPSLGYKVPTFKKLEAGGGGGWMCGRETGWEIHSSMWQVLSPFSTLLTYWSFKHALFLLLSHHLLDSLTNVHKTMQKMCYSIVRSTSAAYCGSVGQVLWVSFSSDVKWGW